MLRCVFLLVICLVCSVVGRAYEVENSFKPPFETGSKIPYWDPSGTAEFAHKFIRFNPRHIDSAYMINSQPIKSSNFELRIQTWTGGVGDGGYSVYFSSDADYERLQSEAWKGVAIHTQQQKGAHDEEDLIDITIEAVDGRKKTNISHCQTTYPHNPNLFLHLKVVNSKLEVRFSYSSTHEYHDCTTVDVTLPPAVHLVLATIIAVNDPVDRQDLYALYTYALPASNQPAETPTAAPTLYQPPKPSKFQVLLDQLLKKYEKSRDIPQSDQIALFNEFFHDVGVLDEQHEHLKDMAAKIKDLVVELQLEQDEEHQYFEQTLNSVISEAATTDDIKNLVSAFTSRVEEADGSNPIASLQAEINLLKEIISTSTRNILGELREHSEKMQTIRNSLDISHAEHRSQINTLNTLTVDLAKTVEENSSFAFWTFVILFQLMFLLGFVWYFKIKSTVLKKDF